MIESKSKICNSAKELLLDLFDNAVDSLIAFDKKPMYKISAKEFAKRQNDYSDIRNQIYYLKKRGLVKRVVVGKEKYFELTRRGFKEIAWNKIDMVKRGKTESWDKYFRIVMFDIPRDKNTTRDILRRKLEKIGFIQLQQSVFVYPFECKKEIDAICYYLSADNYLKYMISNILQGEKEIIDKFLELGVLTLEDLK